MATSTTECSHPRHITGRVTRIRRQEPVRCRPCRHRTGTIRRRSQILLQRWRGFRRRRNRVAEACHRHSAPRNPRSRRRFAKRRRSRSRQTRHRRRALRSRAHRGARRDRAHRTATTGRAAQGAPQQGRPGAPQQGPGAPQRTGRTATAQRGAPRSASSGAPQQRNQAHLNSHDRARRSSAPARWGRRISVPARRAFRIRLRSRDSAAVGLRCDDAANVCRARAVAVRGGPAAAVRAARRGADVAAAAGPAQPQSPFAAGQPEPLFTQGASAESRRRWW